MSDKIIGIDLGTTFSAVGFVSEGKPRILPNGAERIIPSVVGFSPQGALLVGAPARNQYVLYPENTVRSIKRKMGTSETVALNERVYTPSEISAIILREMKRIAEMNLKDQVTRAVITVPAYFSDAARQATKDAGEIAGFTVERIINEPTAAALAYGLDRSDEQQLVAVYDLGGGTFDVSIVELNSGVVEVRASHGNTHLGGDDFDELLMNHLAERFQEEHGLDPRTERKALARLTRAAEQAKITLSSQPFVRVHEEYLMEQEGRPLHLDVEVAREQFEHLVLPLLEGTLTAFDQALSDAGLEARALDKVLFVGGSTRIPLVWELVAGHAGLEPHTEINPDEAVALGAGVQAAIIAGEPLDAILVDVTAHSLGIEVAEIAFGGLIPDRYAVVIHRNTTIPTTKAQVYSAIYPEQETVQIKVYQGESHVASENTLLGEFTFDHLKPEAPGLPPRVAVQFDLDLNGILRVSAQDRGSQRQAGVTVQAEHLPLSPAQKQAARELIQDLELEPDEHLEVLMSRARRLMEEREAGVERLNQVMQDLEDAIQEGRAEEQATLTEELTDLLYELDEE
ncbi:MAG: Hsp70 family protein [Chloroflexi bacterium]|nr:Hsp70 family protein [Chloroflexota bacterium]